MHDSKLGIQEWKQRWMGEIEDFVLAGKMIIFLVLGHLLVGGLRPWDLLWRTQIWLCRIHDVTHVTFTIPVPWNSFDLWRSSPMTQLPTLFVKSWPVFVASDFHFVAQYLNDQICQAKNEVKWEVEIWLLEHESTFALGKNLPLSPNQACQQSHSWSRSSPKLTASRRRQSVNYYQSHQAMLISEVE